MKKERIIRIQDLLGLVNALYPPTLAEDWDNVGLQAGDPSAELKKVLVVLDPSEKALEAAVSAGAQAVVSHHPLIFHSLKSLIPSDATGRVLFRAVREGVAVLCAHTNLDCSRDGLNDWLAERLGLVGTKPLAGRGEGELYKLVVFVPTGYEGPVAEALFSAGAGRVGEYDRCSFRTQGTGTFRPGAQTDPFLGQEGKDESVREVRLETILPRESLRRTVDKMLRAHPYEEVAYDLIPLANPRSDIGLGRLGRLAQETTLAEFAARVKDVLAMESLRIVGDPSGRVKKVAVCGGSGASLLGEAHSRGADVLVTGDVKYHDARNAESRSLALIDAGHFATERLMVQGLAQALRKEAGSRALDLEFVEWEGEEDPFRTV
jgi:dinuclear metal center YbgI/SA1388 family protein